MKKNIIIMLLLLTGVVYAVKLGSLPDVQKPLRFTIDGDLLYIPDQNSLFVYSLKDFKLKQKIGGKGDGPAEFERTPNAKILQDEIVLFSFMKFARFKKDCVLMMEKRVFPSMLTNIYPLGNHYVIHTSHFDIEGQIVIEINIVDQDLKTIKSLYSHTKKKEYSGGKSVVRFMETAVSFQCNTNNIFLINGSKGLFIEVFDFNGQSVRVIEKDFPKIKIPESVKKKRLEDFLKPFSSDHKKRIEKTFTFDFPEYFSAMQDFLLVGDKLYIKTYRIEEDREEYIILDTKGNLLKNVFLPEAQPGSWTFFGNKFYFLKDNDEKEEWELHCLDLQ
ncbi:MAG: hypothetical protein NT166_21735 [Candidatus Aminicenantes bacterium]|nr:hypothetical protein [Candidatus Aminicenantes bacterium]